MAALIESGRVVDLILLVLVIEGAVLGLLALLRKRWVAPVAGPLLNLAAAGCLVLGLRAAFVGADWMLAGLWLGAALVAHASELALRLGYRPRGGGDGRSDSPHQNKA